MRYQLFVLSILLFLIGGIHKGVVSAETTTTITVCNSGCTTNQWWNALNLVENGDTISLQEDIVGYGPLVEDKTFTIEGNGYTLTNIVSTVTRFMALQDSNVIIRNLTMVGGNVTGLAFGAEDHTGRYGGAIYLQSSNLTLENVTFRSNQASGGGAIYSFLSSLTATNSEFDGNVATNGNGGAINSQRGSVTANNTWFYSNVALHEPGSNGGAISSEFGSVHVAEGGFVSNEAAFRGGAINHFSSTSLSLTEIRVDSNEARFGGGLWSGGGSTYIDSNIFVENIASVSGGGLFAAGAATDQITILNNTIVDNSALSEGGGMELGSGQFRLENNTIYRNDSPLTANVKFADDTTPPMFFKVRNNIIALPQGGGDNCSNVNLDVTFDNSTAVYKNLDDDGSCDGFTIEADPRLNDFGINGGPTWTMRPAFDSPVINAGNWHGTYASEDQRGVARPTNGVSDLGAYERVTQGDCHTINETIPGGSSSSGLTKVISAPSHLSGEILDVDVTIQLDAIYLNDITAIVTSPFNVPRTIIDRPAPATSSVCVAGSFDGVFDSDGNHPTPGSACTGGAIDGRFKPEDNLAFWTGSQTEGNWILNVTDATFGAPSSLTAWCVSIEYFPDSAVATPTAVTLSSSQVAESPTVVAILSILTLCTIVAIRAKPEDW